MFNHHEDNLQREYSSGGEQIAGYESSLFPNQLINAVGPDLSIPGQYDTGQNTGSYQGQQLDTHPALFGQNQLEDGLGPVYAMPSFPSPPGHGPGMGGDQWHHSYEHGMGAPQWQQWCSHPPAMIPFFMYPPFGHRSYY